MSGPSEQTECNGNLPSTHTVAHGNKEHHQHLFDFDVLERHPILLHPQKLLLLQPVLLRILCVPPHPRLIRHGRRFVEPVQREGGGGGLGQIRHRHRHWIRRHHDALRLSDLAISSSRMVCASRISFAAASLSSSCRGGPLQQQHPSAEKVFFTASPCPPLMPSLPGGPSQREKP